MEDFIPFKEAALLLEPGRHPLESDARERIDAEWRIRVEANPRLFDGDVMLATRLGFDGGRLSASLRPIRYAGLLHFLGLPEEEARALSWRHVYCWAAVISADGKAIMGRMAGHTANAGRIFFPSGSLESADFKNGIADVDGNMARELSEETGLDLSLGTPDPHYLLYRGARTAAIMRVYRFGQNAAELTAAARSHIAGGSEDELETVLAFAPGQTDPAMAPAARRFMETFKG